MKKYIVRFSILFLLLCMVVAILPPIFVSAAASGSISTGEGVQNFRPGQTISISVGISVGGHSTPAKALGSYQVSVSWDDSVLDYVSAAAGSGGTGFTHLWGPTSPTDSVNFSGFTSGTIGSTSVTGGRVTLRVIGDPDDSCDIGLDGSLADCDGTEIPATITSFTVNVIDNPPTTTTTPPPTTSTPPTTTTTQPPTTTTTQPPTTTPEITYYDLGVSVNGEGVTQPEPGTHSYEAYTVVDLAAYPKAGWQFTGWTGLVSNASSVNTTVLMDGNQSVTANFAEIVPTAPPTTTTTQPPTTTTTMPPTTTTSTPPTTTTSPPTTTTAATLYSLSITAEGSGATTPGAGPYTHTSGSVVNLEAIPAEGWQFAGWTGEVSEPGSARTSVIMSSNKAVTAKFTQAQAPDATPPSITNFFTTNNGPTEVDITWTTDEPSDSQVEFWASPGWLTPLDTAMVTSHKVRLTGLKPGTLYHYRTMSRDRAGNLTTSAEQTFNTAGAGAFFATSNWGVSIEDTNAGKSVNITYLVRNTGDATGVYKEDLTMNGVNVDDIELSLDPGAQQEVSFTLDNTAAGECQAKIGDTTLNFTVGQASAGAGWLENNWGIIAAWAASLMLAVLASVLITRRATMDSVIRVRAPYSPASTSGSYAPASPAKVSTLRGTEPASASANPVPHDAQQRFVDAVAKAKSLETAALPPDIRYNVGTGYLTITGTAVQQIMNRIKSKAAGPEDPQTAARIFGSGHDPKQLKMTLGKHEPDDLVISSGGNVILFINRESAKLLDGVVLDFRGGPEEGGFILARREDLH